MLDENISAVVAEQLRRRGHDVVAVTDDADLRGAPDSKVLEIAATAGRALVTRNVGDFRDLADQWDEAGHEHSGIIFVTNSFAQDARQVGELVTALDALLSASAAPDYPIHWLTPAPRVAQST